MVGCPFCFDLHERVVEWDFTTEKIWNGTLCNDVSASANRGCEGCILIRKIFKKLARVDISENSVAEIRSPINVQGPAMFILWPENSPIKISKRFQLFPSNPEDRSLFDGKASKISGDTSANEAFETARAWLENCVTNHAQCKTSDMLPRRVIDVGELDTEDLPKVVEPCKTQHGKYACLSYCWGRDPEANIRTTKNTLSQRKSGIEWNDIPATITDAILACRKLGIRFLWVDALCIIQDDVQDWALECTNMAEIYSNSYITLAAVAAEDPSRGMFQISPNEHVGVDFNVRIPGTDETAQICAREVLDHISETGLQCTRASMVRPLMKRAWVLQEMLLSPRILRFNPHELSWECCEMVTCECSHMFGKSDTSLTRQLSSHERIVPDEKYFLEWQKIISSFSSRDLTYETDRLPAISAIAREFSSVGGRYFAGIWEKDLIRGLLWKFNGVCFTKRRLDKSAPSWSWTSSPTDITFVFYSNLRLHERAEFRGFYCSPATANEFGSIKGGSITLSGHLTQVLVTCTKETWRNIVHVRPPHPSRKEVDTTHQRRMDAGSLRDDKILSDPSAEMYAFLLASKSSKRGTLTRNYSLILRKVSSDEYPISYERLGLLKELCPHDEPSFQLHWGSFAGTTEETVTII